MDQVELQRLEHAAWHEAGHVWAAVRFEGRLPVSASAVATPLVQGGETITLFFNGEGDLDIAQREGIFTRLWAGRRAQTYYAGVIAERMAEGRWPLKTAAEYEEDFNTPDAVDAHRLLRRFASEEEAGRWMVALVSETARHLAAAEAPVTRVAAALREAALLGWGLDRAALAPLLLDVELVPIPEGEAGRYGLDLDAAVDGLTALEERAAKAEAA